MSTSVKRQDDLISYELGNEVRGFESGEFPDDEIAWKVLSQKFNERFPSAAGRHVELRKVIRWGRVGPALESDPFDLFPIGDRPLN